MAVHFVKFNMRHQNPCVDDYLRIGNQRFVDFLSFLLAPELKISRAGRLFQDKEYTPRYGELIMKKIMK